MRNSARLTMTIPEAARRLGLSRNSAYAAAAKGQIPVMKVGARLLVPISALEKKLLNPRKGRPGA